MAMKTKQAPRKNVTEGEKVPPGANGYGDLADWADIFEPSPEAAFVCAWEYAAKVLTPRALAQERRKAGDPSASPRDYDCGCPISVADKRPRCFGWRDCKFKDRYEAPPRIGNDPVRYQMVRAQYAKLKASLLAMPAREAFERIQRLIDWYDRNVLAKKRVRD